MRDRMWGSVGLEPRPPEVKCNQDVGRERGCRSPLCSSRTQDCRDRPGSRSWASESRAPRALSQDTVLGLRCAEETEASLRPFFQRMCTNATVAGR